MAPAVDDVPVVSTLPSRSAPLAPRLLVHLADPVRAHRLRDGPGPGACLDPLCPQSPPVVLAPVPSITPGTAPRPAAFFPSASVPSLVIGIRSPRPALAPTQAGKTYPDPIRCPECMTYSVRIGPRNGVTA